MRISDWSSDVCSSDLVHIIAVLGQVIIGINAAEQEVERPVKIAGQDRFARPACIILVRSVELQQIGRASCRERVCQYVLISVVAVALKKKQTHNSKFQCV